MSKLIFFTLVLSLSLWANSSQDQLSFFKSSYDESRSQFLDAASAFENSTSFAVNQIQFSDPKDSTLITDAVWLKAKSARRNLIVLFSGLHGIEGFTGSALQSWLLRQRLLTQATSTDYLLVHALNPYGFKAKRRATAENIDLNRNFMLNESHFSTANPAYAELDSFLNPTSEAQLGFFHRIGFLFSALKLVAQHSIGALRQAILVGQYQFPKGIFYGGTTHQYQKQIVDQLYKDVMLNYETVFIVDIHTGYGAKNKLHLLANSKTQPSAQELNSIFGEERIDYGDKTHFYQVRGDMLSYLEAKSSTSPKHKILGVAFEFGTLDSQKTLGSIESLRRIVIENQKHHHGADPDSIPGIESLYLEMFYPTNEHWRTNTVQQFDLEMVQIEAFLKGH
ncbi:MAG: hypothetical protein A2622_07370 [Bdellovibrionales bacterium RIFCSPHIGHO2_01_FULL_40_29]|nr:MAG: hypothetical protein A2622_07370 [Bdellovibrionales bacterium RIFCSPHIGHO2_01_FULL_40_29]OFZ34257.1 MAG: hypothetical protein A3D17_04280 [Bdellovibrionales bacterium RIFCSPHIGHO2_02_FULL_40_15]